MQGIDPKNLSEIPRSQMKVLSVNSEELNGADGRAQNAIDGNNQTIMRTEWYSTSPKPLHQIAISLGANYMVRGVTYLPRQDGSLDGPVAKYSFCVSVDGVNWGNPVASGTFAKNAKMKRMLFAGRAGQFVRFVAQSEINGRPWTSAAEINILMRACSGRA
jgi:hypothetical protein